MQARPEAVLRVVLTALDEVPDDVQGAAELPLPERVVDEPELPPLPLEVDPLLLREPLEDLAGITRGSTRRSPCVS